MDKFLPSSVIRTMVVRKANNVAFLKHHLKWILNPSAACFVDNVKDLFEWTALSDSLGPARKTLRYWIQETDFALYIGGDDTIANTG